ncbi:nucleoside diphosphate kinase [Actinoplanes sp. SE50]|uniref:hypothetical protein n=1 Tax=unclassified Actinoplanes TaxID=2626549 RepID=UPI00023ECBB5|nr:MULTISPECIES: hypothetical protein [unclassified Actinoplanes]AEV87133.1 nucleoside diphosphate kinase [Actinoplanes sp. SE50/110]ATO85531.1 nucleoside diphosphate kinase [Actinoplanes sp. SE50]SLM02944.1 hypothetical protein ACSP50_6229 [Actinoplanes sp. SE50/110]
MSPGRLDSRRFFDAAYTRRFLREELTTVDGKADAYAVEARFRQTLYACAQATHADDSGLGMQIRQVGLGMFRPDAIAAGKAVPTLEYLRRFDCHPYAYFPVQITAKEYEEIWRYQLNVASGERLALLDLMFSWSQSILVQFRRTAAVIDVPVTVLMADVKGPADPVNREGWELRAHLASPSRVETYFHTADEPADVVRDGGLLLGARRFAEMLAEPCDEARDVAGAIARLASTIATDARAAEATSDATVSPGIVDPDPLVEIDLAKSRRVDTWQIIRHFGAACEMYSGPGRPTIWQAGSDGWWNRVGLLADRDKWLTATALGDGTDQR